MRPRRKNVLLLAPSLSDAGGTQRMVRDLGLLLSERHNVLECSFSDAAQAAFASPNARVSLEQPSSAPRRGSRLLGYARRARSLNRLKKQHAVDVTISNLWPADFINALSRGSGARISITHSSVATDPDNRQLFRLRRLGAVAYRSFDRIVGVTEVLTAENATLFSLPQAKMATIPNFVSLSTEDVTGPGLEVSRDILWCGGLKLVKNLAPLLSVFARVLTQVPACRLVVLGDGPERDSLLEQARRLGLRVGLAVQDANCDVVFTGLVEDPRRYMTGALLFVHTAISEGFGLVILEALSAGVPVAASDCPPGGPHAILRGIRPFCPGRIDSEDTPCGTLLPVPDSARPRTLDVWEKALVRLVQEDANRSRKADACRARAADFSRDAVKERWFELLDAI